MDPVSSIGSASPEKVRKDCITVVDNTYLQAINEEPFQFSAAFTLPIESKDVQPYERRLTLDDKTWRDIAKGCWVDKPYMLVIYNHLERFETNPTEAEQQAASKKLLEVSISDRIEMDIPPGASMRIFPRDISRIRLRSALGVIRCTVVILPR